MPFSVNLRRLRELEGLTQEELGVKTGCSKSAISMYERGERFPDEETLEVFADTFNVDMNVLLGKQSKSTYYFDPEVAKLAQAAASDPDTRLFLKAKRELPPEDMQVVIDMIKRLLKH